MSFWPAWDKLPAQLRKEAVKPYYEHLSQRRAAMLAKRGLDLFLALFLFILLSPAMMILALLIKLDSSGPILYRQLRVTRYGREFRICKFRTMVADADKIGAAVTVSGDPRITRMGRLLRKGRLDEFPQLINIIKGEMSFVGTRPEVPKYVAAYNDEMWATLLLPAGLTSLASIEFKDESAMLDQAADVDQVYIEKILPQKMRYNLNYLRTFGLGLDLKLMMQTVLAVIR